MDNMATRSTCKALGCSRLLYAHVLTTGRGSVVDQKGTNHEMPFFENSFGFVSAQKKRLPEQFCALHRPSPLEVVASARFGIALCFRAVRSSPHSIGGESNELMTNFCFHVHSVPKTRA